jgi:hypothetical protein
MRLCYLKHVSFGFKYDEPLQYASVVAECHGWIDRCDIPVGRHDAKLPQFSVKSTIEAMAGSLDTHRGGRGLQPS